jgi:hypothetical protein
MVNARAMLRGVQTARLFILLAVGIAGGCGQGRFDVSGSVAYEDGQSFAGGGFVVLEGTVDGKAVMARGRIGPDGRFTVSAGKPGQGVLAGSYRIRLIPPRTVDIDSPTAKLPYDEKFLACETSGLTFEVGRGGGDLVITLGPRP